LKTHHFFFIANRNLQISGEKLIHLKITGINPQAFQPVYLISGSSHHNVFPLDALYHFRGELLAASAENEPIATNGG
jgi:hypothetical protein